MAAPRCQPQPGGCSGLPRQPRFLPLPGPRGAFARFRFCSQEGTTSERAVPGDGAEPPGSRMPPGSPSLPLTRPHLPANPIGARGSQRQSRAPSPAAQGPPVPQQDPRAPPEVLAAGSRGGREGLHSPAGSAPTCRAISHWGGQLVTGGASLLGGGAGNQHGNTKYCCHGPRNQIGVTKVPARPRFPGTHIPGLLRALRGTACSKAPRVLRGRAAGPAAGLESCLSCCHRRGRHLQGATGGVPIPWPRWPSAQPQGRSARAVCWEPLAVPWALSPPHHTAL